MKSWYVVLEEGMDITVSKVDSKEEALEWTLHMYDEVLSPIERRTLKRNGFKGSNGGPMLYAVLSEHDCMAEVFWDGFDDMIDIGDLIKIRDAEEVE